MRGSPRARSVALGVALFLVAQATPHTKAYEGYDQTERRTDLRLIDAETEVEYPLTFDQGYSDFDGLPSWFPLDAAGHEDTVKRRRYVVYNRTDPGATGMDLYLKDIYSTKDGANLTQNESCNCGPVFSPDGKNLAFHATTGKLGLHVWRWYNEVSGGEQTSQIYYDHNQPSARNPTWSPDGSYIAYSAEIAGGHTGIHTLQYSEDQEPGVYVENKLVASNGDYPSWSPIAYADGSTRIAFSGEDFNLYMVRPDGNDLFKLTDSGSDIDPSFSPDGTRVAFTSYRDGDPNLFVININGTGLRRLTNNTGFDGYPGWTYGDGRIVFSADRVQAAQPSAPTVYRIADYEEIARGSCRM